MTAGTSGFHLNIQSGNKDEQPGARLATRVVLAGVVLAERVFYFALQLHQSGAGFGRFCFVLNLVEGSKNCQNVVHRNPFESEYKKYS